VLEIGGEEDLSWSNGLIWKAVSGKELPVYDYPFRVDVRDVAKAHSEALQSKETRGKRFILASSAVTYSDIADIARKNFPELSPSEEKQKVEHYAIDTSNTKILNFKEWIPTEKTVVDIVQQAINDSKE